MAGGKSTQLYGKNIGADCKRGRRKTLEEAVTTALELAAGKSDGAEVSVSKTTGIGVSTRYGEVENVEFNSDGALGITVYHQNRKGSASSTDLSPDAIARTVQAKGWNRRV